MYTLNLTYDEYETIAFIGGRYSWSEALMRHCGPGANHIPEHIAWKIGEAIEEDDGLLPLLDVDSDLYRKVITFWQSIV